MSWKQSFTQSNSLVGVAKKIKHGSGTCKESDLKDVELILFTTFFSFINFQSISVFHFQYKLILYKLSAKYGSVGSKLIKIYINQFI